MLSLIFFVDWEWGLGGETGVAWEMILPAYYFSWPRQDSWTLTTRGNLRVTAKRAFKDNS